MGKTHAVLGANAAWLGLILQPVTPYTILLIPIGALAGLLPDIDAEDATIHHLGGGALGVFRGGMHHRHFWHSLAAMTLVSIISIPFFYSWLPSAPIVIAGAFLLHILADSLTPSGVRIAWPHTKRIKLLPRPWAWRVNGSGDWFLFLVGSLSLILLVMVLFFISNGATITISL